MKVYPVEDDGYGEPIEYPKFARYRMEPHYPGAAGDVNHDLVLYELDEKREEKEIGRHKVSDVLIQFSGHPEPLPPAEDPANTREATSSTTAKKTSSKQTAGSSSK